MGRETKLDDLVEKRICDALRKGHSHSYAADAGGITENTLHEWLRRGRGTDDRDDPTGRYARFATRFRQADREAEDACVMVLQTALGGSDPKLATDTAWKWLARRRPLTWAEQKGEPPPSEEEVRALVEKIRNTGSGSR